MRHFLVCGLSAAEERCKGFCEALHKNNLKKPLNSHTTFSFNRVKALATKGFYYIEQYNL